MNDDLVDQIRFQLPMNIGARYGVMPGTLMDASEPAPSTRVRIMLGIQTSGDIQSITSPSHPEVTCCPFDSGDAGPSRNRMITTYESREYLAQDFVVNIQARGLDEPRCFAERDPKHGSVSFQLTLVPKLNLPPIATQEYIFLVDRSGSMAGSRILAARRALMMLLRLLPTSGTTFNIFSFGSHSSSMFVSSLPYSQASLADAVRLFLTSVSYPAYSSLPRRNTLILCRQTLEGPRFSVPYLLYFSPGHGRAQQLCLS